MKKYLTITVIGGVLAYLVAQAPTAEDGGRILIAATLLAAYCLPWIVAAQRHHHNTTAIGVLNVLLGWTLIGWVASLVWACTAVYESPTHHAPRRLRDVPGS